MTKVRVLIVDDEPDLRWVLAGLFRDAGYDTTEMPDAESALQSAVEAPPDVVVSDVRMPGMDGVELLGKLTERDPDLPVVLLSAIEDLDTAVGAMKLGAYDFVKKPFDRERLLATVDRAAERRHLHRELAELKDRLEERQVNLGVSARAQELDRTLDLVAPQGSLSLLIQGESGTGKEVIAREIHRRSPFADGPFVAVDCGAVPEQLMESQLFGHRKGAFTGAIQDSAGLFRMADGGTLFLDELGNLPLALQAKLLRVLQERVVVPVGGGEPVPFDARLISATNAQLSDDVQAERFRIDLFHRIAEFSLDVPPLRSRPEDVLHFARHFLIEANAEMGRQITGLRRSCRGAAARPRLARQPARAAQRDPPIRRAVRRRPNRVPRSRRRAGGSTRAAIPCHRPVAAVDRAHSTRQRRARGPDPPRRPGGRRRQQGGRGPHAADRLHDSPPQAQATRPARSRGAAAIGMARLPWHGVRSTNPTSEARGHKPPCQRLQRILIVVSTTWQGACS